MNKQMDRKAFLQKLGLLGIVGLGTTSILSSCGESKDTEVKAHFETNKEKFSTPEQTDTSHILVDSEEECKEIHKKIVNNEITFEDAAKTHSKCPSKEKGGNLGSFPKGQMVPEYEAVAFSMKKDEISEPVKTQFGYHIIKLNDKKTVNDLINDDEKEEIVQGYKDQIINNAVEGRYNLKIDELMKGSAIEKYIEFLAFEEDANSENN